ncbi:MAG: outer membrane beta-barrel protein [Cyclobacteriaceae bacterium]|nr:outer membrane beta-barrel protein [Cyclobacteriaceae bacterium]
MKTLIASCVLLLVAVGAQGQWKFELVAGPSLTTFTGGEKKDWGGTGTNPKLVLRGNLGFRVDRLLSEKFLAGGGIVFALKGTAYQGDVNYYNQATNNLETLKVKYNKVLSYVDVPVYVKYVASDKIKLLAGLQPSFLLSAKIKNDKNARTAYPSLAKTEDAKDYYTGFDLAFLLGPQYTISEKVAVQMLVNPGLLKMAKAEEYVNEGELKERKFKVNNTTVSFTIVYFIGQ